MLDTLAAYLVDDRAERANLLELLISVRGMSDASRLEFILTP